MTGVQTCALPISYSRPAALRPGPAPNPTGAPALLPLTPGCQAPKEPARVLSLRVGFIGSATEPALLQPSRPFCTFLLGFIGLALSRPSYHPLRRVYWRPASPSAYLARVLRSQPEPARITFSASGTRCNPLHRPARLQVGSSAHGSHLSRPAPSSPRRVHGVIPYTGPLAFKWVHRLTAST